MLDLKFVDDETYPLEASASGDNAFYIPHGCECSPRPAYASCLAKCAARKKGRLDERYSDCSAAIGGKRCPALVMRKEEIDKGQALYFVSRPRLQAFNEYRHRMEREAWAKQQATGKKSRKPSEDYEPEALPDDLATFNPASVAGFRPGGKPVTSGVGSYEEVINAEIAKLNGSNPSPDAPHSVAAFTPRNDEDDSYGATLARLVSEEAALQTEPTAPAKELPPMEPGESPLAYARRIKALNEDNNE